MYRQNEENIGSFIEKEFKHEFTYRNTKDEWAIAQGYKHEIDVGYNGDVRFANVKKTVAYVLEHNPVGIVPLCDDGLEQKWVLAKNTVFKTVC